MSVIVDPYWKCWWENCDRMSSDYTWPLCPNHFVKMDKDWEWHEKYGRPCNKCQKRHFLNRDDNCNGL